MTKTSKNILITIFSIMMVFCTFLGITLTFPITTVNAEESTDYLSWERTELKTGDLIANRYLMLDMSFYNGEGKQIPYADSVDDDSSLFNYLMFGLDSLNDKDLFLTTANTEDGLHFFWPIYKDTNYYVWYIEIFEEPPYEFNERTPLKDSSVVILNGKEQNIDGFYFLTEPEEPEDEIPDVPTDLPTTDSTDYDVTYLPNATSFKGSYLVVPENITTGNTIMFHLAESPSTLIFDYAHYIVLKSNVDDYVAQFNPVSVTYRYGVKSYVYDFTKDQTLTGADGNTYAFHIDDFDNDPVIASFGDGDVTVNDCYLLTPKNNAGVPGDELPPADTETPDNENPGNENPGDEAPDKKEPTDFNKFLQKIDNFFAENTGIVLGSTGSLVVLVIALWLLFRRR